MCCHLSEGERIAAVVSHLLVEQHISVHFLCPVLPRRRVRVRGKDKGEDEGKDKGNNKG